MCLTKYRIEEVGKDVFTDIVNIVKIDITLLSNTKIQKIRLEKDYEKEYLKEIGNYDT